MTSFTPPPFAVAVANQADRPVLQRLWALFRHDMSRYSGALPDRDGCFRQERLDAAFNTAGWRAYRMTLGSAPVGLAIVRALETDEHVMSSFFLVNGARRAGLGLNAARFIIRQHPGAWAVAYQEANQPAAQFWRRVATDAVGKDWTEEQRPVPGRNDLPPDTWVRFRTEGSAHEWNSPPTAQACSVGPGRSTCRDGCLHPAQRVAITV
jgi:predicted acetyltransferase